MKKISASNSIALILAGLLTSCSPSAETNAATSSDSKNGADENTIALAKPEINTNVHSEAQSVAPEQANDILLTEDGYKILNWDHLMPAEFTLESIMPDLPTIDISNLPDDAPEVQEVFDAYAKAMANAPLVKPLLGEAVRIPGFVVPLETDGTKIYSFLLVPYMGACIHTPPPPSNQIVYVTVKSGYELEDTWSPIFVYGQLSAEGETTELGSAGYGIKLKKIEPYS